MKYQSEREGERRNIDLLLIVVFSNDLDLVRLISSVCFSPRLEQPRRLLLIFNQDHR